MEYRETADDWSAVWAWLARFEGSVSAHESYRREAERLLLWCTFRHKADLAELTHEDLLAYQRFLANPEPAEAWVMAPGRKAPRGSRDWRPFAGPLSATSQGMAMRTLRRMFDGLVETGHLVANPLARMRPQACARRVPRAVTAAHWLEIQRTVESLSTRTRRGFLHAARVRWMLGLLYYAGLRASEVCSTTMGAISRRRTEEGTQFWCLEAAGAVGAVAKRRLVPMPDELLSELVRYRQALGLEPWPSFGDRLPLVLPLIGQLKPLTRASVHATVKEVMRATAERLRRRGDPCEEMAAEIEMASACWLSRSGRHESNPPRRLHEKDPPKRAHEKDPPKRVLAGSAVVQTDTPLAVSAYSSI